MRSEIEEANFKARAKEPFALPSRLAIAMEKAEEPVRGWLLAQIEAVLSEIPFRETLIQKSTIKENLEPKTNRLLTPQEAGAILNIPVRWIYRHAKELPHKRVGKYIRFPEKDLMKWIEKKQSL